MTVWRRRLISTQLDVKLERQKALFRVLPRSRYSQSIPVLRITSGTIHINWSAKLSVLAENFGQGAAAGQARPRCRINGLADRSSDEMGNASVIWGRDKSTAAELRNGPTLHE